MIRCRSVSIEAIQSAEYSAEMALSCDVSCCRFNGCDVSAAAFKANAATASLAGRISPGADVPYNAASRRKESACWWPPTPIPISRRAFARGAGYSSRAPQDHTKRDAKHRAACRRPPDVQARSSRLPRRRPSASPVLGRQKSAKKKSLARERLPTNSANSTHRKLRRLTRTADMQRSTRLPNQDSG